VDDVLTLLPPGLIRLDDARRVGVDPRRLYEAERRRALFRVRPGAFVRTAEWSAATTEERHLLIVRAAAASLREPVFSHESAAAVWGVPLLDEPRTVHVLAPGRGGGSSWNGVVRHQPRSGGSLALCAGIAVTSALDTVLDLAASRPFATGVVAADHAVRLGLVTPDELVAAAAERRSTRGGSRAVVVAKFADARAESPGESLSRARMHELRLAAPDLQVRLRDVDGLIGRVDFWWRDLGLVGEFDGRVKYRVDGIADPRAVEDRLWAEKTREDRLRAAGARVARWTWQDAMSPERLAGILARGGLRPG
jgi:hypothetical protein